MFPIAIMSMLKFSRDRELLLALMMSMPRENKHSKACAAHSCAKLEPKTKIINNYW